VFTGAGFTPHTLSRILLPPTSPSQLSSLEYLTFLQDLALLASPSSTPSLAIRISYAPSSRSWAVSEERNQPESNADEREQVGEGVWDEKTVEFVVVAIDIIRKLYSCIDRVTESGLAWREGRCGDGDD
jgi:hypothetical protein